MTTNEEIIKGLMIEYANRGFVTIPCTQKKPAINSWNDLPDMDIFERIDWMFANKFGSVTGLAILITKENPGLRCADIDSNDHEQVEKILRNYPSQINKYGRKGCSFFFRSDEEIEKPIERVQFPANLGFVEIFRSNKYVVIPPSLHSKDELGDHYYHWYKEGCTLLDVNDIDDLPFISDQELSGLYTLVSSPSTMTANKNLPVGIQYGENGEAIAGRFETMKSVIGTYVASKNRVVSFSEVIAHAMKFDAENLSKNSFFDARFSNRKEIKRTDSMEINSSRFITEILSTLDRENKITFKELAEVPVEIDKLVFKDVVHVVEKEECTLNFKGEWIPHTFRELAVTGANANGVSLQSLFYPLIAALAGCLQGKVIIRPKKMSLYYQRPNLPVVLLAHSGSRKTDINKIATFRINKIYSDMQTANPQELIDKQNNFTERIIALNKDRKLLAAKGSFSECEKVADEKRELQDQLDELLKEVKPHIWLYKVASVQKIIKDHSMSSKTGLLFTADEFSSYLALMMKKGNEEFRTYMMECFNGDGVYKSSTLSRGDDLVDPCYASMLTTLQPDVLKVKIADMFNPSKVENDGFWTRLIFILMGKPTLDRKGDFNPMNFLNEYKLFDHAFYMHDREVHVADDSLEFYDTCLKAIEVRAFSHWGTPIGSFLSKHQGRLCKYAYIAEFLLTNGKCTSITKKGLEYAMLWIDFEAEQLLEIFSINDEKEENKEIMRIIEMIKSGVLADGETVSKWHQTARGSFRSLDYFLKHLKKLESHGYIMMIDLKANSKIIKVNPSLWR